VLYAKLLLPANVVDVGLNGWSGHLLEAVRVGGDLRAAWSNSSAPNTASQEQFALEQFRVYGDVEVIPNRLALYVDEQVAPNASQNEEAYVRYGSPTEGRISRVGSFTCHSAGACRIRRPSCARCRASA